MIHTPDMWHTEDEDEVQSSVEETIPVVEASEPTEEKSPEVEDAKEPEYKNYKTFEEIPDKEKKHYGI